MISASVQVLISNFCSVVCVMSFNTNFKMGLKDLDIIEVSLRKRLNDLSKSTSKDHRKEICEIRGVLGNLHNQKVWYRPKSSVYVGG